MRIISGSARGLKLNTPSDKEIRPTTDRVKESLFNIISHNVYDSCVLDLFAGSGALGIECISRGARQAYFCDNSEDSIKVIQSNIDKAKFNDKSVVLNGDYKSIIQSMVNKNKKFDIVFIDPPYYKNIFEDVISLVGKSGILKEDAIVVVEHDAKDTLKDTEELFIYKEKKYGITKLTFYSLEENNG
ncbi:16S rRNA (guanine(966)-N(2))-methyltransferase RsmD [Peptostreptococcus faecalis]|uniref:16S rRNA (guanine(966)-N(2))-methyltransferase RsmD n=1 Tax=Peptostreptococcus faecalis TaxID=2045015 RepID=UPI000C7DD372|nr:16S rRNA (guanine(966)-N(2))-methyltransferase RsmD [Peptostreptococcus faecalis]